MAIRVQSSDRDVLDDRLPPLSATIGIDAPRIYVLGGFRLQIGQSQVSSSAWQGRAAARTLVKILAIQHGHKLHREKLLEILWPDAGYESRPNNFAKALHAARNALEPRRGAHERSTCLTLRDGMLVLNADRLWLDIDAFEALARHAVQSSGLADLALAVQAYGGPLLPEDEYADWSASRREEVGRQYANLLERFAQVLEESGDRKRASDIWRDLIEVDGTREAAHRALMRFYLANGERQRALQQYRQLAGVLAEDLGTEPERASRELYQAIGAASGSASAGESIYPTEVPTDHIAVTAPTLPTLVGRDPILENLKQAIQAAMQGSGRVVLFIGSHGVGKTRLATWLARFSLRFGTSVMWKTAYRQQLAPYGPFIQMVESELVGKPVTERVAIAARFPALARVIPSLVTHAEGATLTLEPATVHALLGAEFAAFFAERSEAHPLVVVLDDLHAADIATQDLFVQLARQAPHHRWLLVGALRRDDGTTERPIAELLSLVTTEELGECISVDSLSYADTRRLVNDLLPGVPAGNPLIDRVHALSLGNPLFIRHLIQTMRETGDLRQNGREWTIEPRAGTVSPRVTELFEKRLAALHPPLAQLLGLASVFGPEWRPDEVLDAARRTFAGMTREECLAALDSALQLGMIEDRGTQYAFSHPLLHAAVLDGVATHRRSDFHDAVAGAIERSRPGDVDTLAFHYVRSADDAKAIEFLERAADRNRTIYANAESAALYEDLLLRLERHDDGPRLAQARGKLAMVLTVLGRYPAALDQLERAATWHEQNNALDWLGIVAAQIAHVEFLRGTWIDGLDRLDRKQRQLDTAISPWAQAAMHVARASLQWLGQVYDAQVASAERAVQLMSPLPESRAHVWTRTSAESWLGIGEYSLGRTEPAVARLERVLTDSEKVTDLRSIARAHGTLARATADHGDTDAEAFHVHRAVEAAERLGSPPLLVGTLSHRAWVALSRGETEFARVDVDRAASIDEATGPCYASPYAAIVMARLYAAEGDSRLARDAAQRAYVTARTLKIPRAMTEAQALLAQQDLH